MIMMMMMMTLLSVSSKVLSRIILKRVKSCIEKRLRTEQEGYQNKRSRTDQINTLHIITEQSMGYVANLYLLFVDFEKAFDSSSFSFAFPFVPLQRRGCLVAPLFL
jgi:hypothetical protein